MSLSPDYAQEIVEAFKNATLSTKSIRTYGNLENFNLFEYADFGFIEVATRHLLDLIESPRNLLNSSLQIRTTAAYTTIHLINQLLLSNKDISELN
ncbi:unnamed protein product [Rhizopus stolonifer]